MPLNIVQKFQSVQNLVTRLLYRVSHSILATGPIPGLGGGLWAERAWALSCTPISISLHPPVSFPHLLGALPFLDGTGWYMWLRVLPQWIPGVLPLYSVCTPSPGKARQHSQPELWITEPSKAGRGTAGIQMSRDTCWWTVSVSEPC